MSEGNLLREGGTEYRHAEYRLPIEQIRGLALNIKSKYKLPNIYLGGSQSPKSKHYPKRTSDIDLFSYFDTYEQLENYARTVGKDTMELLTFVPRAGLAGQETFMGRKVMLSISFMDLKPENLGEYDDQILLDGGNLTDIAQNHRAAERKTVYIAGMPEAVKDNRARMQELGNMLREGGYEVTGRGKFENIYRGEGGTSRKGGSYWSPSAEWAKQFTQTGRIEEVKKAFIKSDDIYTAKELPYAGNPDAIDKAVTHAKNKGFKAVRLSEGTNEPQSVYIFDLTALKSVSAMAGVMETLTPTREPWQMTKGEFAKTAVALPDRKDFIKAWLKDNEDIPDLVKPGFNYIEQRNGSLLVFGNQGGHAIGIISMRKDVVEHIAVSDRYKDRGIATQLLEESRKYGVRRIIGAISPEVVRIVHRFTVKTAFMENKPVPQEVLREYPDLVMKAEKQKWRRVS